MYMYLCALVLSSVLCAAEGGLKDAHAEEWVSLGALSAISMALEVSREHAGLNTRLCPIDYVCDRCSTQSGCVIWTRGKVGCPSVLLLFMISLFRWKLSATSALHAFRFS